MYRSKHKLPLTLVAVACCAQGCSQPATFTNSGVANRLIPAEEFTRATHDGEAKDFSIFRASERFDAEQKARARLAEAASQPPSLPGQPKQPVDEPIASGFQGDPRYLGQGYQLKQSMHLPSPFVPPAELRQAEQSPQVLPAAMPPTQPALPPGSSAPYVNGQMTGNPSLWPDEGQGASLFRDFRAFQAMDVITILVNESSEGRKKAKTDNKTEFSLTAAIANFFGVETKSWQSNNEGLDPTALVNATTDSKFKGEGETNRSGTLKARLSAVIMEVLPNGLLRLEGTKIIAVNDEEEVMVLSGLVRERDIEAQNQVDSSRIANMRIDFYGRGVVADQTAPGWGMKIFQTIWPF